MARVFGAILVALAGLAKEKPQAFEYRYAAVAVRYAPNDVLLERGIIARRKLVEQVNRLLRWCHFPASHDIGGGNSLAVDVFVRLVILA
jgi:hypothetical protein